MQKFNPLLCSTPVVEALIAKRKTKTRRVVKEPAQSWFNKSFGNNDWSKSVNNLSKYQVGDILWVRETFRTIDQDFGEPRYEYKATEKINLKDKWKPSLFMPKAACRFFLQVKSITVERLNDISEQDAIAEGVESCIADKEKFGCRAMGLKLFRDYEREDNSLINHPCNGFTNAYASFITLWENINGKGSWDKNPWVWVIEFEQIERPSGFI